MELACSNSYRATLTSRCLGHFGCHNWGERVLPASCGQGPGSCWTCYSVQDGPHHTDIQLQIPVMPTNPALYWKPRLELAAGVLPCLSKSFMRMQRGEGYISPSHQRGGCFSKQPRGDHSSSSPTSPQALTHRREGDQTSVQGSRMSQLIGGDENGNSQ